MMFITRHIPEGDDFLDPSDVITLDAPELARRTRLLVSLIRDHAAEAETLRRPVAAVWSAIRRSGFFYQFVPKAFCGMATDTDGFIDAALPLAMADPGTAWSACFCAGHNRTLAHFSIEAQREIWGGGYPYIVAPSLGAPPAKGVRVDGGCRITGAWSWGSGVTDADWILAMAMIENEGESPQIVMTVLPAAEARVTDTWRMDGLAASGSNDVSVDDIFIPAHRMMLDVGGMIAGETTGARDHPEPVFHMPMITFASFVAVVPVLGAAKGLLELYRQLLPQRTVKGSQTSQSESPVAQSRLAQADLMISGAEQIIRHAGRIGQTAAGLEADEQVPLRVRLRAEFAFAVKLCRDAAALMTEGAGSSVHHLDQPFQRMVRDIGTMASHVAFDTDASNELHGRLLLGMSPNSTIF
jgi:3-hydroxy-9,10-secoandrosta-1,3,5(10)-triene-9,17-dione monooxygenase